MISTEDYRPVVPQQTKTNSSHILADALRLDNDYEISELFMESANANLYTARCRKTGRRVLMKQLPKATSQVNLRAVGSRLVPPEVYFNFAAYHPGSAIVRPVDYFEKRSSHVLVMEYVEPSIDLFELIKRLGALNTKMIKTLLPQLIHMWSSLDRAGICHRDIKDENIIVNIDTLECKLIDFGCATEVDHSRNETVFSGTPEFYPPEYYSTGRYTHDALTAWNIGCVVYTLFAGDLPVKGVHNITAYDITRDPLVKGLSPAAGALLLNLLHPQPEQRCSVTVAAELVQNYLNEE